jgi:hypothetical protein
MGIAQKTLIEYAGLESAMDLMGHTHNEAYRDMLNKWSAITEWITEVTKDIPEGHMAALLHLIMEEEQLAVKANGKDFIFWLNCSDKVGAGFDLIDPKTEDGMQKLKWLLVAVSEHGAYRGILYYQVIVKYRTNLPSTEDTIRTKVDIELIRYGAKGHLFCGPMSESETAPFKQQIKTAQKNQWLPVSFDGSSCAFVLGKWFWILGNRTTESDELLESKLGR